MALTEAQFSELMGELKNNVRELKRSAKALTESRRERGQKIKADQEKEQTEAIESVEESLDPLISINKNIAVMKNIFVKQFAADLEWREDQRQAMLKMGKKDKEDDDEPKVMEKGDMSELLQGLLLLGGGIAALIAGLFNDGPFKGLLKLAGKIMAGVGLKTLKGILKPFAKILGMLKNIGKFFLQPLAEKIPQIAKTVSGFFKNIGKKILRYIADTLLKPIMNVFKGLFAKTLGKTLGKGGGKAIFKMVFSKILKFAKPLFKLLKKVPVLGGLIAVGFAISRFKSGDIVGGLLELASGLANLANLIAPGLGTAISLGIDIFLAWRDLKKGKEVKKKKFSFKSMIKSVGKWLWDKIRHLWPVKPILMVVDGFKMMRGGKVKEGLWEMFKGLFLLNPIFAPLVNILGFLEMTKPKGEPKKPEDMNFFEKIIHWIRQLPLFKWFKAISDAFGLIMDGDIVGGFKKLAAALKFGMFGWIFSLFGDKSVENEMMAESESKPIDFGKIFASLSEAIKEKLEMIKKWATDKLKAGVSKIKKGVSGVGKFFGFGDDDEMTEEEAQKQAEEKKLKEEVDQIVLEQQQKQKQFMKNLSKKMFGPGDGGETAEPEPGDLSDLPDDGPTQVDTQASLQQSSKAQQQVNSIQALREKQRLAELQKINAQLANQKPVVVEQGATTVVNKAEGSKRRERRKRRNF